MNQSTKDSFGISDLSGFKSTGKKFNQVKEEDIHCKVNEAKDIILNARERMKKSTVAEEEFYLRDSEGNLDRAQGKYLDSCILASDMRNAVRKLEKEVSHLALLSDQMLNPGYYRRNPYPHPWRLTKLYSSN